MLITHLYALYLSKIGLEELKDSIFNVLDDTLLDSLPLKASIKEKLQINSSMKKYIIEIYKNVLNRIPSNVSNTGIIFDEDWISIQLDNAPQRFDEALNRW